MTDPWPPPPRRQPPSDGPPIPRPRFRQWPSPSGCPRPRAPVWQTTGSLGRRKAHRWASCPAPGLGARGGRPCPGASRRCKVMRRRRWLHQKSRTLVLGSRPFSLFHSPRVLTNLEHQPRNRLGRGEPEARGRHARARGVLPPRLTVTSPWACDALPPATAYPTGPGGSRLGGRVTQRLVIPLNHVQRGAHRGIPPRLRVDLPTSRPLPYPLHASKVRLRRSAVRRLAAANPILAQGDRW